MIVHACSPQGVGEAATPCALPPQQVLQSVVPDYSKKVIGGCHLWICPSVLAGYVKNVTIVTASESIPGEGLNHTLPLLPMFLD